MSEEWTQKLSIFIFIITLSTPANFHNVQHIPYKHYRKLATGGYIIGIPHTTVCVTVMNSASLNLGIETYKYKPLYSIVSRPRMILRCDWLIGIT